MSNGHGTPVAIVVAGCAIGAGLFFGLRARSGDASAPAPATRASAAYEAAPTAAAGATRAPAVDTAAAQRALDAQIDARLPKIRTKCWEPSVAKSPDPASIKLTWQGTFGPDGKLVSAGVSESREASRPDVTQCVHQQLVDLSIAPPGAYTPLSREVRLP